MLHRLCTDGSQCHLYDSGMDRCICSLAWYHLYLGLILIICSRTMVSYQLGLFVNDTQLIPDNTAWPWLICFSDGINPQYIRIGSYDWTTTRMDFYWGQFTFQEFSYSTQIKKSQIILLSDQLNVISSVWNVLKCLEMSKVRIRRILLDCCRINCDHHWL